MFFLASFTHSTCDMLEDVRSACGVAHDINDSITSRATPPQVFSFLGYPNGDTCLRTFAGSLVLVLSHTTGADCMVCSKAIVSVSRSPPGQAPKRLDFWSSFSQSWGSLVSRLAHFSIIGSTLGMLGAHS